MRHLKLYLKKWFKDISKMNKVIMKKFNREQIKVLVD